MYFVGGVKNLIMGVACLFETALLRQLIRDLQFIGSSIFLIFLVLRSYQNCSYPINDEQFFLKAGFLYKLCLRVVNF